MNEPEFNSVPQTARPHTTTVLALLTMAAAIFSYLSAYAMANALVVAEMLKPWPRDHDPRPQWFIITFLILISIFFALGSAARCASRRQLRQIDEIEE